MDYLVNLNLNRNELQNAVVQPLGTAPSPASEGQIYYNSSSGNKQPYYYNGTDWLPFGAQKTTTTPLMDGEPTIGSETQYAAGNHVHPSDTTKADKSITVTNVAWDSTNKKFTKTINGTTSDIVTAANLRTGLNVANGAEVNQNAFSNVKVGNTTIEADSKTDTLEFGVSTGIYLTADTTNDKITIEVNPDTALNTLSGNSVQNKAITKEFNAIDLTASYSSGTATINISSGANGQVSSSDTFTIPNASSSTAGLMSSSHYSKLDGISSGTSSALETGTSTTQSTWTPKILHDYVYDYVSTVIGGVDAMRFKGTVNSNDDLPTTNVKVGDTYMVNTAGIYAGQTCEVGDLIIATATTPTWTVAQTNINGAITSLSGTAPISVSGSGDSRTISIAAASGSSAGSMSSAHYTKLEGIPNVVPTGNARIFYGYCSTSASSESKTVTCTAYDALTKGDIISVAFTYTNTATSPTLNVNSKGAKVMMKIRNGVLSTVSGGDLTGTCLFVYDGSYWVLQGSDTNTTYSNATTTAAGLMSATDKTTLDNLAAASQGAITHTQLTIDQGTNYISASSVSTKLITFQAYQDGEAVVVDYGNYDSHGICFYTASNVSSAVTIKCVVTV